MEAWVDRIGTAAFSVFTGFVSNAHYRHFWVYTIFGLLIAIIAHRISGDRRPFLGMFFARKVWLSRSAANDYLIVLINPVVLVVGFSWVLAHFYTLRTWVASGVEWLGLTTADGGPSEGVIAVALTVSLYVANDFARFYSHYLQHRIPLLWEFHKVHHSAEHLNFATAERFHPVDVIFVSLVIGAVMTLVNGLFLGLFPGQLSMLTLFGANSLWVGSNVIGGVLRHSPAWVRYGPGVERWLISPAMHQIHHSDDPKHFDKNIGGSLAIWDRMAGTLYIPEGREITGYGIGPETAEYRTLSGIYWGPIRKAYRLLRGKPPESPEPAKPDPAPAAD